MKPILRPLVMCFYVGFGGAIFAQDEEAAEPNPKEKGTCVPSERPFESHPWTRGEGRESTRAQCERDNKINDDDIGNNLMKSDFVPDASTTSSSKKAHCSSPLSSGVTSQKKR